MVSEQPLDSWVEIFIERPEYDVEKANEYTNILKEKYLVNPATKRKNVNECETPSLYYNEEDATEKFYPVQYYNWQLENMTEKEYADVFVLPDLEKYQYVTIEEEKYANPMFECSRCESIDFNRTDKRERCLICWPYKYEACLECQVVIQDDYQQLCKKCVKKCEACNSAIETKDEKYCEMCEVTICEECDNIMAEFMITVPYSCNHDFCFLGCERSGRTQENIYKYRCLKCDPYKECLECKKEIEVESDDRPKNDVCLNCLKICRSCNNEYRGESCALCKKCKCGKLYNSTNNEHVDCEYVEKVGFGKYENLTFAEVFEQEYTYCKWFYENCTRKNKFYRYLETKFE